MKILFICTGNVCRSPLAEGYLKHLVAQEGHDGIEPFSAGVAALTGAAPFECAIEVAGKHQFDISKHRAKQITLEIAHDADLIVCMETWQTSVVLELDQKLVSKVVLLGSFHPNNNKMFQIPDPRNFDVPCTMETFDLIKPSVERFFSFLRTK